MICGCAGSTGTIGGGSSPVLVFSDVHFNPLYDGKLLTALDAADPSQWKAIYEGSTVTTMQAYGADTDYLLFKLALSSIQQNLAGCQLVVYSGDLSATTSRASIRRMEAAAIRRASTHSSTTAFVTQQIRACVGNLPVLFAVGNCDSYTGYGPDSGFLSSNVESFYTQLLNGVADQQQFTTTFSLAAIILSISSTRS